ncbi:MAG: DUF3192 domain-containing protein [Thermodesulfobacteriota bacterium]
MSWLSLVLIVIPLVWGCGQKILTQWPKKEIFATYFREQGVKLGMSREAVEGIMGPPQIKEEADFRGGRYLLYFYRTHNMDYSGSSTVRGGYTPLVFQNNQLVGKGRRDYLKAIDRAWMDDLQPPSSSPTQGSYQRQTW